MKEKKIDSEICGIFPTPIYMSSIDRSLSSIELSFIEEMKKDTHESEGNFISNNNYVLENIKLISIKKELELRIQDYFIKVLNARDDVIPYITQSWLTYTDKDQFHHQHKHPNSFISGVFYANADEEFDSIKFFKDIYQPIIPGYKDWNLWNSESWYFKIKTGDIILFPSSLAHMVDYKKGGNTTRVCLAFNTFLKGKVGDQKDLTELKL